MFKNFVRHVLAVFLTLAVVASAQQTNVSYYWDANGAESGFGTASGTWGEDVFWTTNETGMTLPEFRAPPQDADLFFGAETNVLSAGVINVTGEQQFGSLSFGMETENILFSNGTFRLTSPETPIKITTGGISFQTAFSGAGGLFLQRRFFENSTTNFLRADWMPLFSGIKLSEVVLLEAHFSGGFISNKGALGKCFYFINNGNTASAQMQIYDGKYTKCVKVELRQGETAVEGRIVYSKYYALSETNKLGFNFDGEDPNILNSYIAEGPDSNGYVLYDVKGLTSVPQITLQGDHSFTGGLTVQDLTMNIAEYSRLGEGNYSGEITNNGSIVWGAARNQTLRGILSGAGNIKCTGSHLPPITFESPRWTNFLKQAEWTRVFTNAYLADCTGVVHAVMGGTSVNAQGTYAPATNLMYVVACHFKNNGSVATCQLQGIDDNWLKCVLVSFRQNGFSIEAIITSARYIAKEGHDIGFDFENESGWSGMGISTSLTQGGYGVAEFGLAFEERKQLVLDCTSRFSGGILIDGGNVIATNQNALPSTGEICVTNGGVLRLKGSLGAENEGGVGNKNPIYVTRGGTLVLDGLFVAGDRRLLSVDGGTLSLSHRKDITDSNFDGENYVNQLRLANGAVVEGNPLRALYHRPALYHITGATPSYLKSGINLVSPWADTVSLTCRVENVTGDAAVDFYTSGRLTDYSGYLGAGVCKTGAGTMLLAMTNSTIGKLDIQEGVVQFGCDAAVNRKNMVCLNGGGLDLGSSTNQAGILLLATDSVLEVAKGKITFEDCSGATWTEGSLLTITGKLEKTTIRFGTNDLALTAVQLDQIRYQERRVLLNEQGYLQLPPEGTVLQLR